MALYTHVEAQPASLHGLARYFHDCQGRADAAGASARTASAKSEPWTGQAADGFCAVATSMYQDGAELGATLGTTGRAVDAHAEDMRVVHQRMQDARGTAAKAGLSVTAIEIHDPGPAPPKPNVSPTGGYGGSSNSATELVAMAEYKAWADKAAVYAQCATMVAEARTIEQKSQNELLDAIDTVVSHPIIQGSDLLTGLAAGYLARQASLRTTVSSFTKIATEAAEVGNDATHSAGTRARNLTLSLVSEAKADVAEAKANTSKIGAWLEKQPDGVKKIITKKIGQTYPKGRPFISKAPLVFKRIPVLGTAFAGAAVVADAVQGKDVTKSVVSNGVGLVTGTATGLFVGGPAGAFLGFVVGTGASIISGDAYDAMVGEPDPLAPGPPEIYQTSPNGG